MTWLSSNWIWILVGGGFVAMHLFGHGHGGHRSHATSERDAASRGAPSQHAEHASHQTPLDGEVAATGGTADGEERDASSPDRHRHHGGC